MRMSRPDRQLAAFAQENRRVIDTKPYEKRLRARKSELEERLQRIEHDLDQPMPADDEDRATEREGDEVLEGVGNVGAEELRAIDAALGRIEAGTYGICTNCGEPISPERLDTLPTATKCRHCM